MSAARPPLVADAFFADPRLAEARRLIHEALREHQRDLGAVRPPKADLQPHYDELLRQFADLRGGVLYFPYLGSGIGCGPYVELADGSVKLDLITGIGAHPWGHSREMLLDAALDAALRDTVMQGNLQQNVESVELSRALVEVACRQGAALHHCFLSTSGAMANENALKIIFQQRHPAPRLLAFENCFAGRTLALSQVTDKPAYRDGLPAMLAVDYVPFFAAADPAGSTRHALAVLQQHLARHPGQHAAMVLELVQGEGGYYPGERNFFIALLDVLRDHSVLIAFDEIQTFGRTSQPFAFQHFQLDAYADVVSIGKLSQVCATLFRDELVPRPGLISQTFTGSTAAIFAARAILRALLEGEYFGPAGRTQRLHEHFVSRLEQIAARLPGAVAGPFGIGAMIGFTAFDGDARRTRTLAQKLFEAGLISFVAGANPTRLRFLLPVGAITTADIDRACTLLEETLVEFRDQVE